MFYLDLIFKNIKLIGVISLITFVTYLIVSLKLKSKDIKILNKLVEKKDILLKERIIVIDEMEKNFEDSKKLIDLERVEENKKKQEIKDIKKFLEKVEESKTRDYELKL